MTLRRTHIDQRATWTTLALLAVALAPAICIVWFMSVAMRNERLAVQQTLTEVYQNHLTVVQVRLAAFWKDKQSAFHSLTSRPPHELFATVVRSNLADSILLFDDAGSVVYPSSAKTTTLEPTDLNPDWLRARQLEFQDARQLDAAQLYLHVAAQATNPASKALGLQRAATCYLKASETQNALSLLLEITRDSAFENAATDHGSLIVPNAQLLLLKLTKDSNPSLFQATAQNLARFLNTYESPLLTSDQRRFLMAELQSLTTNSVQFDTFKAEQLAAEFVDTHPQPPLETGLYPTALPNVCRWSDGRQSFAALFYLEHLRAQLKRAIDEHPVPGVDVQLIAPKERLPHNLMIQPHDASEHLPGWRLALLFTAPDPFASLSLRQTRIYLWTGSLMVLFIGILALAVARYVTAQMRLARLKDDLVSTVSHELKTPLSSIRVIVDTLLAGRFRGPDQLNSYLGLIARENHRLSHLIENFLSFSRMQHNKQKFQIETVAPSAIVDDALASMHDRLAALNCHFRVDLADDLPSLQGDREALATVLINLLENAWKYSPNPKKIHLRASRANGSVTFEVQDNGIGIQSRDLPKIFDRFYQADHGLTRKSTGCGLGLSIVQFIVRGHSGTIDVQSQAGHGSTFTVKLPITQPR